MTNKEKEIVNMCTGGLVVIGSMRNALKQDPDLTISELLEIAEVVITPKKIQERMVKLDTYMDTIEQKHLAGAE